MQELRQITPEHFWPSALAAKQLTKELVCRPATLGMPSSERVLEFCLFFLSYWKPFFMHNQTFHLKSAVFSPAVTKATWETSATRKAI